MRLKGKAGGMRSAGVPRLYVDHQPLCRLETQSVRSGARLSRQTMMEWVAQGAMWSEIIYRQMLAGDYPVNATASIRSPTAKMCSRGCRR